MKCLKNKCHYFIEGDGLMFCDLVINDTLDGNKCIGYEQIEKEMDDVMRDMEYAIRRYKKLQKLKARIVKIM